MDWLEQLRRDTVWEGPSAGAVARRRALLGELRTEIYTLPKVLEAMRQGNRAAVARTSAVLSSKIQKLIRVGPISAIEKRMALLPARQSRCATTLTLAEDEAFAGAVRDDLLMQVPKITAPPGAPAYSRIESATLKYVARNLDQEADDLVGSFALSAPGSKPNMFTLAWSWAEGEPASRSIATDADAVVSNSLLATAQAAVRKKLESRGPWSIDTDTIWPEAGKELVFPGRAVLRVRAPMTGSRFDPDRSISWQVCLGCPGPTRGQADDTGIFHGYGMFFECTYDVERDEVDVEVHGWNT